MNAPDWKKLHGKGFEGQRVLVTGGAGFIGSHLIEALLVLGAEVVALDDLSGGSWDNLMPFGRDVRKITASVTDASAVRQAIKGCAYAFHEAALASVPQSVAEPQRYYDVNLNGTLVVATAAKEGGVRRLVFAGSSSAYGDPPGQERTAKHEALPPLPLSPYASSKTACEELLRAWSHSYGLDTAVLRYFNVFGHRQNANSAYAAVIAAFAKALAEGRRPIIFGDGEQTRDFVFVQNVVHANLLAARRSDPVMGEIFNVATGSTVTVNELFRGMARAMGKGDVEPEYRPPRTGDVRHSSADISKAKRVLGYEPIVSCEEGLTVTVAWYGGNG